MLDVHAPHRATHSWREFLSHIAAIAIGLLLALALEKLAEYVHERHQLTEARRELAMEVVENRRIWAERKFDYTVRFYATKDDPWQLSGQ